MYQQYLNQAKAALDYLSSDELKELLNDDDKLEERVNDVVRKEISFFSLLIHVSLPTGIQWQLIRRRLR